MSEVYEQRLMGMWLARLHELLTIANKIGRVIDQEYA